MNDRYVLKSYVKKRLFFNLSAIFMVVLFGVACAGADRLAYYFTPLLLSFAFGLLWRHYDKIYQVDLIRHEREEELQLADRLAFHFGYLDLDDFAVQNGFCSTDELSRVYYKDKIAYFLKKFNAYSLQGLSDSIEFDWAINRNDVLKDLRNKTLFAQQKGIS